MVALHRQYVRPTSIESLTDESKDTSGIDENLLFASEVDLNGALLKVNSHDSLTPETSAPFSSTHSCANAVFIPISTSS